MAKLFNLTILFFAIIVITTINPVQSEIIIQEDLKTHLRWNLLVPKDQFYIIKKEQNLLIETVNLQLFEVLTGELTRLGVNEQYVEGVSYSKENFPARPATITVKLRNPT